MSRGIPETRFGRGDSNNALELDGSFVEEEHYPVNLREPPERVTSGGIRSSSPSPLTIGPFVQGEAEFDSFEEVDAVVRSLRRVALRYAIAIVAMFVTVPVLSLIFPWWTSRRIWGGLTPHFITVAFGLNVVLILVALLYNRVANRSEDEMLGRPEDIQGWTDV